MRTPPPSAPPADAGAPLTIQEVTRRTGVPADTLRYYERLGVLPRPSRTPSGHRRFDDGDLAWLEMVGRLRMTGMPLARIRDYARLVRAGDATLAARREMLERHAADVERRMAELQAALAAIHYKLDLYRAREAGVPDAAPGTVPAAAAAAGRDGMMPEPLARATPRHTRARRKEQR